MIVLGRVFIIRHIACPGGSIRHFARYRAMRIILVASLLLIFAVQTADARKRRHHYRYIPNAIVDLPRDSEPVIDGDIRGMRADPRGGRRSPPTLTALVPSNWQEQPSEANWNGK